MNTLVRKTTAVVGLMLSISFVSCQDNRLLSPEPVRTASAREAAINPGVPQKYTLTKHGQATLAYYGDGRLQKVTYGPGPNQYSYIYYSYGPQWIKATYYAGSTVVHEALYTVDANGRCVESKETEYVFYSFGKVEYATSYLYHYNALGQLKSRTNKGQSSEHTDYVFNAAGDLSKATLTKLYGQGSDEVTFIYDQPVGDPILADRYPLNSTLADFPDPYLKLFGKPSKHLVKMATLKKMPENQVQFAYYYSYLLNPDGYVTEAKEFNVANAALISTKPYEYLVTGIGFHP
ncbi:MAG: hypothetical protein H7319_22525 [Spirosoma sp.]|nr:hypothetical protein [Spirosoma sp.]